MSTDLKKQEAMKRQFDTIQGCVMRKREGRERGRKQKHKRKKYKQCTEEL